MKKAGKITLGEHVIVSDPSYQWDIWCNIHLDIKPGTYDCFVEKDKKNGRISKLLVLHEQSEGKEDLIYESSAGVDSGQMGVFDMDYYMKNQPDDDFDNLKSWYRQICQLTLRDKGYGTKDKKCVVSRSGYGDGTYPVYCGRDKDGFITSIMIDYYNSYSF